MQELSGLVQARIEHTLDDVVESRRHVGFASNREARESCFPMEPSTKIFIASSLEQVRL
jgi:hypothetical protein